MSQASLRWLLVLLVGVVLTAFLCLRLAVTAWERMAPAGGAPINRLAPQVVDAVGICLLLFAAVAGCFWLTSRARHRDREQARVQHLAEVGLLAGGLAHEIRNTLNAMHSQIGLLRKQLPPGFDCQRTGQLEGAVVELDQLLSDFLAFARPANDSLEKVDLGPLIADLLEFAALDLEQGRVRAVTELSPDLPSVYVDRAKLKRALLNLIINARQAMPDGGTLTVGSHPDPSGDPVIEVHDSGCGIPDEDRPRVFQTFFSTKPDGTGLGLAVVKRTIEDFGGQVTFDSEIGRGTTFRISLPTAERRRVTLERESRAQQKLG
jgi:signal transduction histidine kinase